MAPTPFTHALKDARSFVVPELKREVLDMELLKGIVEQEGARITSRQCRGIVNRWNPIRIARHHRQLLS